MKKKSNKNQIIQQSIAIIITLIFLWAIIKKIHIGVYYAY